MQKLAIILSFGLILGATVSKAEEPDVAAENTGSSSVEAIFQAHKNSLFVMHANNDIDASYAIASMGTIYKPGNFKDAENPRCAIWGGQDGNYVSSARIHAGEDIVVAQDPQNPLSFEPTLVLELLDANGKQFAGLTCSYMDSKTFSTNVSSIRNFLNTQFGSNAEIK